MRMQWAIGLALLAAGFPAAPRAAETLLGQARIEPGVKVSFKAAIQEKEPPPVDPYQDPAAPPPKPPEETADLRVKAFVTWDEGDIPLSAVAGGFIPYVNIRVMATNEAQRFTTQTGMKPVFTLEEGFHYEGSVRLPGGPEDPYTLAITVSPPPRDALDVRRDWADTYRMPALFRTAEYTYRGIRFLDAKPQPFQ